MTNLRDRQEGYERKFVLDEEQRFKAMARRNRLLGLWAAEKLGKSGADADEYARSVVKADFEEAGDDDVFRKVMGDLTAAGVNVPGEDLKARMSELLSEAVEHVKNS